MSTWAEGLGGFLGPEVKKVYKKPHAREGAPKGFGRCPQGDDNPPFSPSCMECRKECGENPENLISVATLPTPREQRGGFSLLRKAAALGVCDALCVALVCSFSLEFCGITQKI